MENTELIGIVFLTFLVILFIYWKTTIGHFKREYGEKRRKLWGQRTFYWEGAIIISSLLTILIIYILEWADILTF